MIQAAPAPIQCRASPSNVATDTVQSMRSRPGGPYPPGSSALTHNPLLRSLKNPANGLYNPPEILLIETGVDRQRYNSLREIFAHRKLHISAF
jgi:hypothetical protein